MQAVILAGGRGTRMGSLTETMPKPMLKVNGKNLIELKLDALPSIFTEVVIVVGYLESSIRNHFGSSYKGRKISYAYQEKLYGTANALWQARPLLGKKFMVMMGDDLYSTEDISKAIKHDWAILVKKIPELKRGGKVIIDNTGHLLNIAEGSDHGGKEGLVNTGLYVLQNEIFNYDPVKLKDKEEWGLPQTIIKASQDYSVKIVEASFWLQITDADDLESASRSFQVLD